MIAGVLAYGEGLPKAVVLLIALGVLAFVMLLLAGWRVYRAVEPVSDEERLYQEELARRRAVLRAEEQAEREAANRKLVRSLGFGSIGDHMATAFEEMEKDKKAEAEARRQRMIREVSRPPPRPPMADFSHIGKAILDRHDGEVEVFPYRKAVLQLSEVKATAMQRAGEKQLSRIDCHMDIENHARQQFRKCRVRLVAINGERLDTDQFLRIGKLKGEDTQIEFAVRPLHSKSRINFMKRDLDDVVSNPPFLLCLNDRDLPLSDGKEYKFVFALECEYDHPTYATVRFFVPEREKVEIELLTQSLDMPDD